MNGNSALIEAAQRGDQLAFERLLHRYQRLLDAHASRFYLPDGDADDLVQEARIGFMKAVRFYRGGRGSSVHTFAELCVSRQLAGAITAARRSKHQPLNEAARGDQAERALAAVPDHEDPLDTLVARNRLGDLLRQAGEFSELERYTIAHALAGWSTGEASRRLGLAAPEHRQRPAAGETKAPRMAEALCGVIVSAHCSQSHRDTRAAGPSRRVLVMPTRRLTATDAGQAAYRRSNIVGRRGFRPIEGKEDTDVRPAYRYPP